MIDMEKLTEDNAHKKSFPLDDEILVILHYKDDMAFYVVSHGHSDKEVIDNAANRLKAETGLDLRKMVDNIYAIAEIDY